jgi:hypothetical protein
MPSKVASKKNSKKDSKKKSPVETKKYKLYCGIREPIPDGYRLGSMEECLNAGKVNYYGVKKIDSRLLAPKRKEYLVEEINKKIHKLRMETARLSGTESRYKKNLDKAETTTEKNKIKKLIQEVKEERDEIIKKMNKFKEELAKLG